MYPKYMQIMTIPCSNDNNIVQHNCYTKITVVHVCVHVCDCQRGCILQ